MYANNAGDAAGVLNLQSAADITATANGVTIDLQPYEGEAIFIAKTGAATAGTNPTMDLKLQHSDDDSSYTDVTGGAFAQTTTVAKNQTLVLNTDSLKRYVQITKTIGGTSSPSFPVAASCVAFKKNPG